MTRSEWSFGSEIWSESLSISFFWKRYFPGIVPSQNETTSSDHFPTVSRPKSFDPCLLSHTKRNVDWLSSKLFTSDTLGSWCTELCNPIDTDKYSKDQMWWSLVKGLMLEASGCHANVLCRSLRWQEDEDPVMEHQWTESSVEEEVQEDRDSAAALECRYNLLSGDKAHQGRFWQELSHCRRLVSILLAFKLDHCDITDDDTAINSTVSHYFWSKTTALGYTSIMVVQAVSSSDS